MEILAKIADLASLMQQKREQGERFILLLGAGASLSSGVKPTGQLMRDLVEEFGRDVEGKEIRDRFDRFWQQTPPSQRELFLKPHLERTPSPGYRHLAELIERKYFDTIITLNYDNLLQTALQDRGFRDPRDFKPIIRGDHTEQVFVELARNKEPRVKILKLHGSVGGARTFLFSQEEMVLYPNEIKSLVEDLTRQEIVVCGYGFEDNCMVRAFSPTGEAMYCVDPGGVPPHLAGVVSVRKSTERVVSGEDGKFDNFFEQLYCALLRPPPPPPHERKPNPFKFLESCETADSQWFLGRETETQVLLKKIEGGIRAIHVLGKPKVGKTSLMRAGLMAKLDRERFFPVYVRCSGELEQCLPRILKERYDLPVEAESLQSALRALAGWKPDKHVVLILDQFERVVRRFPDSKAGRDDFAGCLQGLCPDCDNLTVVFVAVDDSEYSLMLNEMKAECVPVRRFESGDVDKIIRVLAKQADARFDEDVIAAMLKEYDLKREEFSLAHIQAICHMLCAKPRLDVSTYQRILDEHLTSLNKAINECDVMSFFEDMPLEEQRALLRNIMKIVSPLAKGEIAESLRDHFSELMPAERLQGPPHEGPESRLGAARAGN